MYMNTPIECHCAGNYAHIDGWSDIQSYLQACSPPDQLYYCYHPQLLHTVTKIGTSNTICVDASGSYAVLYISNKQRAATVHVTTISQPANTYNIYCQWLTAVSLLMKTFQVHFCPLLLSYDWRRLFQVHQKQTFPRHLIDPGGTFPSTCPSVCLMFSIYHTQTGLVLLMV